jgi:hypothetical protein
MQEELEGWDLSDVERREVESEFVCARAGDHLMTPFQCDLCLFRNVRKMSPRPGSDIDQWVLTCLRRANLDAFWATRPSTVLANLREARLVMRCSYQIEVEEPLLDFRRGPFPVRDLCGAGMAINLLQRSLDPGRNSATIQFGTCRKMRSFYSNYVHTTPFGTGLASMTDGKRSTHLTASPTNTPWFKRFMDGFHGRLGDVVIQDQALSIDELLAFQEVLEVAWTVATASADQGTLFELATIGAAVTTGFASALRGEELSHARLRETLVYSQKGLNHPRKPHVLLSLLGRFKGVIGRKRHQVPLVPTTQSGVEIRLWLSRLLNCYTTRNITTGPLFRAMPAATVAARTKDLDVLFHRYLLLVQVERPDLIGQDVEISSVYSLRRSLRRGSTAQARNKKVPKDIILLNNRWRSEEASRNRQALSGEMIEYYTDVVVAIEALLQYSEPL